ncbi:unnamed protein product [Darwinula stevensoni]|uniref:TauD/TfdA-like domain-containing protein n=1 Tax=Darwinula stevensoni TaxID=69355 RepID=A0A7R9AF87_9CRUS|nr:unnamed protein product [Darwinula stevensoni]CAG0902822.1 unnamed protein product [Darwinula stevensoni]
MQEKLPRASFQKILSDDKSLYEFLHNWEVYGLVLIKGAPLSMGQVRKVAERIAFIRRTHYGEEFSVIAKPNPSNVAYDAGPLQLHADLPYYQYKPGAELLHCIVQAEGSGGANTLVDGLHLAEMMRVQDPHSFNLLSSVHVDWSDIGVEDGEPFHKIHQAPILCLHPVTQELERINFSQPQRDSFFRIPLHIVEPWYRALKAFHAMAMDPSNCMTLKLNPGDMLAFDNIRILHGRKDFGTHLSRHIEGCYVDWDEVRSKSRVLEGALAS